MVGLGNGRVRESWGKGMVGKGNGGCFPRQFLAVPPYSGCDGSMNAIAGRSGAKRRPDCGPAGKRSFQRLGGLGANSS